MQEGETPGEDPRDVFAEHGRAADELQSLIARINRTNLAVSVGEGTMTDVLARRDVLRLRIELLRAALEAAGGKADRYSRTEIKMVATIDVRERQAEVDRMSREYRELETSIQAANWANDLLD